MTENAAIAKAPAKARTPTQIARSAAGPALGMGWMKTVLRPKNGLLKLGRKIDGRVEIDMLAKFRDGSALDYVYFNPHYVVRTAPFGYGRSLIRTDDAEEPFIVNESHVDVVRSLRPRPIKAAYRRLLALVRRRVPKMGRQP